MRRVVAAGNHGWADPAPFAPARSLADALLEPTRIYVKAVLALHRAGLLQAAAHITGGGLAGNLPRVLPPDTRAVLQPDAWPRPAVMGWLGRRGAIPPDEMLRVFNCGVGMALVVEDAAAATTLLEGHGETVFPIGRIEAGSGPATVVFE